MTEQEILRQAKIDFEELKKKFKEDGSLEYGLVKGFMKDGKLEECVLVDFMDGHKMVFSDLNHLD